MNFVLNFRFLFILDRNEPGQTHDVTTTPMWWKRSDDTFIDRHFDTSTTVTDGHMRISVIGIFFLRLLLRQLLWKLLKIRFLVLHRFGVGSRALPWGAEVENLFLSISSCICICVFTLFTNGHVDLITGSESSTYWSYAVLWKKKKKLQIVAESVHRALHSIN